MASNLKKLLEDLTDNIDLQKEYSHDPKTVMERYQLTDEEKKLMEKEDTKGIQKYLNNGSPVCITVIHDKPDN